MTGLPVVSGGVIPAPAGSGGGGNEAVAQHPTYAMNLLTWRKMRDCYAGQDMVKARGEAYLPPTTGMVLDGMGTMQPGAIAYEAYKRRARYHEFVTTGVETYIGLLHQKEAVFVLPPKLKPLVSRATKNGESLLALLRRVNEAQLVTGRIGLLFDIDTSDPLNPIPFIATYEAESIQNWDAANMPSGVNSLNMVVLNESGYKRSDRFNWTVEYRYRALLLSTTEQNVDANSGVAYTYELWDSLSDTTPTKSGRAEYQGKPLEQIPFVFINATDTLADIRKPPLNGLADLSLTVYRTEADYRQSLFMQGQDTLVIVGGRQQEGESLRTGSGASIYVDMGGDAKYIGVNSQGLPEMRQAVQNDIKDAQSMSGQLTSQQKANAESGEAMQTRLAAQTATLNDIALTGGAGLETLLKIAAVWMGEDPEAVQIKPNLEFSDFTIPGQEIQALGVAKTTTGLPLSLRSMHQILLDKGLTQMTWEEEQAALAGDEALLKSWGINLQPAPASATVTGTGPGAKPAPSAAKPAGVKN